MGLAAHFARNSIQKNDFLKKASETHGQRYCYNEVEYKRSEIQIKINCKTHGLFQQTPNKHLQGQGCPKCGGTKKSNTKQFIAKAKHIHNSKYGYEYVQYKTLIIK